MGSPNLPAAYSSEITLTPAMPNTREATAAGISHQASFSDF